EREKLDHVVARVLAVALQEDVVVSGGRDERCPLLSGLWKVEREVQVHVDEASDVLRSLDVPAHPVDRVRHPAQHGAPRSPSSWGRERRLIRPSHPPPSWERAAPRPRSPETARTK